MSEGTDKGKEQGKGVFFGYRTVKPEEKERLVREQFNRIARRYDLMNTLLSGGIHHVWKRAALKAARIGPGMRVLDVCGGTGDMALLAARAAGRSGTVILCDSSRSMMEAGRQKLEASPRADRIACVQADSEHLPFPDGSVDRVIVAFGVRNLVRPGKGLSEMCRVLGQGGLFVCLELSKPRSRPFRLLYDLYSFVIMPLAGGIVARSRNAYTYLPESVRTFPDGDRFMAMLGASGFTPVGSRRLTGGIASIYTARKEETPIHDLHDSPALDRT